MSNSDVTDFVDSARKSAVSKSHKRAERHLKWWVQQLVKEGRAGDNSAYADVGLFFWPGPDINEYAIKLQELLGVGFTVKHGSIDFGSHYRFTVSRNQNKE